MKVPTYNEVVASLLALGAGGVVAFQSVQGSEQATGALVAVVAAAVGFYLRGRLEKPAAVEGDKPNA